MAGGAVKEKWEVNSAPLPFCCPRYAWEHGCESSWREQGGGNQCPQLLMQLGPGWWLRASSPPVLQGWAREHLGMQHSPQHPAWCPAGRLPGLFISRQCFLPVESSTQCWFGSQPYWRRKGFSSGSLRCSFQPELHASFASQFSYVVTLHL